MSPEKLTRTTGIAAKLAVRFFFILLLVALAFITQYSGKASKMGFIDYHRWQIVFPLILILGFITLLVLATIKKYKQPDLNMLLTVNTVMLTAYGVVLFFRIAAMIR
jgi:cation transport ATPase